MDSNVLFIRTCLLGVAGFVIIASQLLFLDLTLSALGILYY